jgi:tRNA pseudouridine55 synthase
LEADKEYAATALLGTRTSTGDAEGDVIEVRHGAGDGAGCERVAPQFTGPILQTPPMHSALKKDGKALYEYASAGIRSGAGGHVRSQSMHWNMELVPVRAAQQL